MQHREEDLMSLLRTLRGKTNNIVPTPIEIADTMIGLIPNELINGDSKFIDISSKTGIFLRRLMRRLMHAPDLVEAFPDEEERMEYIEKNQLYGISYDEECYNLTKLAIHGVAYIDDNVLFYRDLLTDIKDKERKHKIKEAMKEKLGTMKFDVVIGNPPYNRGMDIDFVFMGHEIARECSVFITPAKWQTAEANQRIASEHSYGDFRREIVPHISDVVFYPDCKDAFDIAQSDGVTYYKVDKVKHEKCNAVNKCRLQKYFNSSRIRNINNGVSLLNVGNDIINYIYIYIYKAFKFKVSSEYKYCVYTTSQLSTVKSKNSALLGQDGTTLVTGIPHIVNGKYTPGNAEGIIFTSDSMECCKSFESWWNTRFTRFFVACNISKLTGILTDHYFRFVPAPPSEQQGHPEDNWNHIYTDEELYEYFGLNKEEAKTADGIRYRDIIDSVIKERK